MTDAHRVGPHGELDNARSRSSIAPLAFALVIGAALGFAAGFGVGTSGGSGESANPSIAAATLSDSNGGSAAATDAGAAATTGSARTFTEATVPPVASRAGGAPRAAAAPVVGSLLVRSTPLGARVFVDGREYGRTPVTVGNLARGGHRVRVTRDGYAPDERQVTITPAQRTHSITVRLAPERPAIASVAAKPAPVVEQGTGRLTVESRPAGAQVFLDGRLVGTTPLVLDEAPAGEHALHLDRDGYQRWSSAIRIVASKPNRVAASLDR
jgi:hypothetical protein